jgi:tetratricopeptide (TPR) repeat protein
MDHQPITSYEAPIHGSHHLPVRAPEQLFGREADLASIHQALRAGKAVLLHGPAGIGKTALAASLAAGYAELPGGVLWFDIADDSFLSLRHRTARAYGADLTVVAREAHITLVRDLLRENRPLVVLDGRQNINATREFVSECASGVPVLLTHTQPAAGSWTPHTVGPLDEENAQAMLFSLTDVAFDADIAEVTQLSQALAGIPLAICMAAHQLAAGVQHGAFLKQIPQLPPGETNRLMGVMMAAYRVLPAALQGGVLLLGTAFAGGASADLLAATGGAPPDVIRQMVRQVAARGFASEHERFGQTYFNIHEAIQTFAQAFLRGKHQLESMHQRHLKGVLAYAGQHADDEQCLLAEIPTFIAAALHAAQHDQPDWVTQLAETLNAGSLAETRGFGLELAWLQHLAQDPQLAEGGALAMPEVVAEPEPVTVEAWEPEVSVDTSEPVAVEEETPPAEVETEVEEEPAAAVDLLEELQDQDTVAAQPMWLDTGTAEPDVLSPVEIGADAPAELPAEDEALLDLLPTLPEPATPPDEILAEDIESLERLGKQAVEQGTTSQTIDRYAQAIEGYQADGNIDDELAALEALAALNLEQENYDEVLNYLDQGMALAQQADSPQREGHLLVLLGDLQLMLGKEDGAETAYREAVTALRPTEAWLDIALTLDKLGLLYFDQRRFEDAIAVWNQTLPIFERVGRPDLRRMALNYLGDSYAELMQWSQSQAHYQQALDLAQENGDDQGAFEQYADLGRLMEVSGNRERATGYYQHALNLAFDLDDQEQLGHTLLALAQLLIDDTTQLHRVIELLEAASIYLPDQPEVKRLLNRARTRRERLESAGVELETPEDSLEDYIRAAVEQSGDSM